MRVSLWYWPHSCRCRAARGSPNRNFLQRSAWAAVSGFGSGGLAPQAVGFDYDTVYQVAPGTAKYLLRYRVAGVFKAGMGFDGDLISATDDQSDAHGGLGGNAVAQSVTISNDVVKASSKLFCATYAL